MKTLCAWLVLLPVLFAVRCYAQQVPLPNAPAPALNLRPGFALNSSVNASSEAAVQPVQWPEGDEKRVLTRMDWVMLGVGGAMRFLDYKTTVKLVSDPVDFREIELPQGLVHNRPALGAFEAGTVAANYFAYRFVIERGHRKLARIGQGIYLGTMAGAVGWNDYELIQYWPRRSLPVR